MQTKITSRSAIESGLICKRKRLYNYHALETGVVPGNTASVDLVFGIACHAGVQKLLEGGDIEEAVAIGRDIIEREKKVLVRSNKTDFEFRADLRSLTELILRLFHYSALPQLLRDYKILSVEKEQPIILYEDIIIAVKADATLEELDSGRNLAFSLKTCTKYEPWLFMRDRMALQNFTEPWAYKCSGVQMCYLQKGQKGTKFPFEGNTLLYPWAKDGSFSWAYFFPNPNDQTKRNAIGPTWERVKIWEKMSIKDWVAFLVESFKPNAFWPYHRVDPFALGTVIPLPTYRHPKEIEIVVNSLKLQEKQWFDALGLCDQEDPESLERYFPREFTACSSLMGQCDYYNACMSNSTPSQLVQMGMTKRISHHDIERDSLNS